MITLIERHFYNACGVVALAYLLYLLLVGVAGGLHHGCEPVSKLPSEDDGYAVNCLEVDCAD